MVIMTDPRCLSPLIVFCLSRSVFPGILWTINDTAVAKRWLDAGVDGIMTYDPGALHAVFEPYRQRP